MSENQQSHIQSDPAEAFRQEEANMASFFDLNAIPYEPVDSPRHHVATRAARLRYRFDLEVRLREKWDQVDIDGERAVRAALAIADASLQTTFSPGVRLADFRTPLPPRTPSSATEPRPPVAESNGKSAQPAVVSNPFQEVSKRITLTLTPALTPVETQASADEQKLPPDDPQGHIAELKAADDRMQIRLEGLYLELEGAQGTDRQRIQAEIDELIATQHANLKELFALNNTVDQPHQNKELNDDARTEVDTLPQRGGSNELVALKATVTVNGTDALPRIQPEPEEDLRSQLAARRVALSTMYADPRTTEDQKTAMKAELIEIIRREAAILNSLPGTRITTEKTAAAHRVGTANQSYDEVTSMLQKIVMGLRNLHVGVPVIQPPKPREDYDDGEVVAKTLADAFGDRLGEVATEFARQTIAGPDPNAKTLTF